MVAAWIRAETGVGPAIASGSQTYSGICADLPQAPKNSNSPIPVSNQPGVPPCTANAVFNSLNFSVPNSITR